MEYGQHSFAARQIMGGVSMSFGKMNPLIDIITAAPVTDPEGFLTRGDSITFSTPTIEGTVLRRNKLDGNGKHPWKAEANEDDTSVPASVITGWYTQVYEPVFSVSGGGED